jgi:hypothetical protein
MINRKKAESQGGVVQAISSALQAASPKAEIEPPDGGDRLLKRITMSTRIEEKRYQYLKNLFGARGITMSRAILMCTDYIAKRIEFGDLEITMGGIVNNRRGG